MDATGGWVLGVLGIITSLTIFLIQERRIEKLRERDRTDAWHLYRTAHRLWAKIEGLLEDFNAADLGSSSIDHRLTGRLGEAYGISVELTRELIRIIKQSEPVFDEDMIDLWTSEGKVPNEYGRQQFRQLMSSKTKPKC